MAHRYNQIIAEAPPVSNEKLINYFHGLAQRHPGQQAGSFPGSGPRGDRGRGRLAAGNQPVRLFPFPQAAGRHHQALVVVARAGDQQHQLIHHFARGA